MTWSVSISPLPLFDVDFNNLFPDEDDRSCMLVGEGDAQLVWWPAVYEGARIDLIDGGGYFVEATVRHFYPDGGPDTWSNDPYLIAVIDWDTWRTRSQMNSNTCAQGYVGYP